MSIQRKQFLLVVEWEDDYEDKVNSEAISDQLWNDWKDAFGGQIGFDVHPIGERHGDSQSCATTSDAKPTGLTADKKGVCPRCASTQFKEIGSAPSSQIFSFDKDGDVIYEAADIGDPEGDDFRCAGCEWPIDVDLIDATVTTRD